VVGVADHGGWAILVSAAAVNGVPTVIDRRRVPTIDAGVPTQPYHHDTLSMANDEAERLVSAVKRSVAKCTALAFERLAGDLGPEYRVLSIAVREPTLERLPATVKEAHASYHVQCRADGMLYHSAICTAAGARDWAVVLHRRGEEVATAARALKVSVQDVERFMDGLKKTLKQPWSTEHRHAFAATIGVLSELSEISWPGPALPTDESGRSSSRRRVSRPRR
jgi:hypothetical protein